MGIETENARARPQPRNRRRQGLGGALLTLCVIAPVALTSAFLRQVRGQPGDAGTASLHVTVLAQASRKLSGARIAISSEKGSFKLEAVTKDDGAYQIPQLPPGRYRMVVSAACYEKSETEFEVEPGVEAHESVILIPSRSAGSARPCRTGSRGQPDSRAPEGSIEFSDSGDLRAGELPRSVDSAGYSSQAQIQGDELLQALGELKPDREHSEKADEQAEEGLFERGKALSLQDNLQQAQAVFSRGVAEYPRSERMLLGLGIVEYSLGHSAKAVDALGQAVDVNPKNGAPYFLLAQICPAAPMNGEQIIERLASYAALEPRDAAAQYDYALCLWKSRASGERSLDIGRVEDLLRSAIALDPTLPEAHFQLGVVLDARSEDALAEAAFERVIALDPDWAEAHYRLAQAYERTGQQEKARREITDYERLRTQGQTRNRRFRDQLRRMLSGNGVS